MPTAHAASTPAISVPSGGGAVRGLGETFTADPFTGTITFRIPLEVPRGRSGFGPTLSLQYSSGQGNSPFGLGWNLGVPRVSRRTDRGVPHYQGADRYVLSGHEELVPLAEALTDAATGHTSWARTLPAIRGAYAVERFRPRTEGAFARIERWQRLTGPETGDVHWRACDRQNVTSIFGRRPSARLADPDDPRRVFAWLLEEAFDRQGNHILYEYASDPADPGVSDGFERNRVYAQRYLRRIFYGNTAVDAGPVRLGLHHLNQETVLERRYFFEIAFDYGDGTGPAAPGGAGLPPPPESTAAWPVRPDPFSTCRAGFELRTLRRCGRILVFHHGSELGGTTLTRSFELAYDVDARSRLSMLRAVTQCGYRRDGATLRRREMPPVTLQYTRFAPQSQRFEPIRVPGDQYPPSGLAHADTALVDLFGRGLPDILETSAAGHRYWRNLGNGRFDRPRPMRRAPAGVRLSRPGVRLMDLAGDGQTDLVTFSGPAAGSYETAGRDWSRFRRFSSAASAPPEHPAVRLVDLTGDGRADLVVTTPGRLVWYECLGEEGFDPGSRSRTRPTGADDLPDTGFNDPQGRLRIADMNGDGLEDLVLLHDGRVEYWPNLGDGRFGRRVTMGGAPRLGREFDPARLFLADVDGSGTADLIHVGADRVQLWLNQAGNTWSEPDVIRGTPFTTSLTDVRVADILGTGTTTLVWSDHAGVTRGANYRFLDLCGGVKPYVLAEAGNEMGVTTRIRYAPSTRHMLEDEAAGHPWITRLPFPVQVVDKVETLDRAAAAKQVTSYRYHHGFFAGADREFRGFARVDQLDTEDAQTFAQPGLHGADSAFDNTRWRSAPVLTRTWFHTGAYVGERELTRALRAEFDASDPQAFPPGDHLLALGESPRDAYRALRGATLRVETYGLDGTAAESRPYRVSDTTYLVQQLQEQVDGAPGVYHTTMHQTFEYQYERDPSDPRIAHVINLAIDRFGNVLEGVAINYPRRAAAHPEQRTTTAILSSGRFINVSDRPDCHIIGVRCETKSFEIHGLDFSWPAPGTPGPVAPLDAHALAPVLGQPEVYAAFDPNPPPGGLPVKRLIEWTRHYFRADHDPDRLDPPGTFTHRLALGMIEPLALPYEQLQAVFDDALAHGIYGAAAGAIGPALGYHREPHAANDDPKASQYWWTSSGRQAFDAARFYLPVRLQDAYGHVSALEYDRYALLLESTTDPLGNRVTAVNDYRVLRPSEVVTPNGNRTLVAFDTLGFLVGTASTGKPGEAAGGTLAGFEPDLDPDVVRAYLSDPLAAAGQAHAAERLLRGASTRTIHDLHRFRELGEPVSIARLTRLAHASDGPDDPPIARQFSYLDGQGRERQWKALADHEAGSAPRWVASAIPELTNKGKPARKVEPFFSATHRFEPAPASGVSSTLLYDPLQRVIGIQHANHTFEKTRVSGWMQEIWDANDTALVADPAADADVGPLFAAMDPAEYLPTWYAARVSGALGPDEQDAAARTAPHAGTPATVHLDALGRTFLREVNAGGSVRLTTRLDLDASGNVRAIVDARGITAFAHTVDMVGRRLLIRSADAGTRRVLPDADGRSVLAWDSAGRELRTDYDALRRPVRTWVREAPAGWRLVSRIEYGESVPSAAQRNLLTRPARIFDESGVTEYERYDFEGRPVAWIRRLPVSVGPLDWNAAPPALRSERLRTEIEHDAIGRATLTRIEPDAGSAAYLIRRTYRLDGPVERIEVTPPGGPPVACLAHVTYNARSQQHQATLGNGAVVEHEYDSATFRLVRSAVRCPDGRVAQALEYQYDPMGNVLRMRDGALPARLGPAVPAGHAAAYRYDQAYRLIEATGLEAASMDACRDRGAGTGPAVVPFGGALLRSYAQTFEYDLGGNLKTITHAAGQGAGWTRRQTCEAGSNRLLESDAGCPGENGFTFAYDGNGNPTALPHVDRLVWDESDRLVRVELPAGGVGARVHYAYDASGRRVHKAREHDGAVVAETIYGDGFDIEREHAGGVVVFERHTVHVVLGGIRAALVERRAVDTEGRDAGPAVRVRYQLGDHLGSSLVELDDAGSDLAAEQYYPYGGTAYQAGAAAGLDGRRYRFGGREQDRESGLYYWGHRYYAPWLGRWISPDPADLMSGRAKLEVPDRSNLYVAFLNNPLRIVDSAGLAPTLAEGTHPSAVTIEGFDINVTVEQYREFSTLKTHVTDGKAAGGLKTSYNPSTGTLTLREGYNPWRGSGKASGLMDKLLQEQLAAYNVEASQLRYIKLDSIIHEETVAQLLKGEPFEKTAMHQILQRRAATLGIQVTLESAAEVTVVQGKQVVPSAVYRVSSGMLGRLATGAVGGANLIFGVAPVFWTALTDDPKRAGQFHREPLFHPYAAWEQEEFQDNLARREGFRNWGHYVSALAFKLGCDNCLERSPGEPYVPYGGRSASMEQLAIDAGAAWFAQPEKAEAFLNQLHQQNSQPMGMSEPSGSK